MSTPETKVKVKLQRLFKKYNVLSSCVQQSGFGASSGYPDYLGYTSKGVHFVVEVKSATGKLSPLQLNWKTRLEARKVPWFLYNGEPESCYALELFLANNSVDGV